MNDKYKMAENVKSVNFYKAMLAVANAAIEQSLPIPSASLLYAFVSDDFEGVGPLAMPLI